MLQFVVISGDDQSVRRHRSLVLVLAPNFDLAAAKALRRGRQMESGYVGGTGQRIRWLLERIVTIDQLDENLEDGREVYSEPLDQFPLSEIEMPLLPEKPDWGSSGV